MRTKRRINGGVRKPAGFAGVASLVLLALASPAWADVAAPGDFGSGTGSCGLLGGATLSVALTLGGFWIVRTNRRSGR